MMVLFIYSRQMFRFNKFHINDIKEKVQWTIWYVKNPALNQSNIDEFISILSTDLKNFVSIEWFAGVNLVFVLPFNFTTLSYST